MSEEVVTLQGLHYNQELANKLDKLKDKLNVAPPEAWMKVNPYAGNSKYLPIDKVEFLLDRYFQQWKCEVLREGVMFNSITVTVRVHYVNPVTGQWEFQDGVGAKACQLDTGSRPSDMTAIKAEAVQMALPMAKSYAIKDACDHIGKIFGRDANRKNTVEFAGAYSLPEAPKDKSEDRILKMIESCTTKENLEKLRPNCISQKASRAYDAKYKTL
jgi:hypothetical protein